MHVLAFFLPTNKPYYYAVQMWQGEALSKLQNY